MPELADHIPYEQVTQALHLDWAWFELKPRGAGRRPVLIRPVSVGERVQDPEARRQCYTFTAVDHQGQRYEIAVRDLAAQHPRSIPRERMSAVTEYTIVRSVPVLQAVGDAPT